MKINRARLRLLTVIFMVGSFLPYLWNHPAITELSLLAVIFASFDFIVWEE